MFFAEAAHLVSQTLKRFGMFGVTLVLGLGVVSIGATGSAAAQTKPAMHIAAGHLISRSHQNTRLVSGHHHRHARVRRRKHLASASYFHSGLQCVPYAREVSHIDLSGDAFLWWAEASGRYSRGNAPVEGAVLNFRSIRRMPLGHVAVVTSVVDSRTILVTQANWIRGSITNDVTVQDVSADNDWSEVQVELGDSSKWGAPYPTYGFIYRQPDDGTMDGTTVASTQSTEVAEAPKAITIQTDAPNRNLQ